MPRTAQENPSTEFLRPNAGDGRLNSESSLSSASASVQATQPPSKPTDPTDTTEENCSTPSETLAVFTFNDWLWEIAAAVVSLCCVSAVVSILFATNDKALSHWSFLISPNALISIFSTLSRASLMVPIASCLGQLKWIYFARRPHRLGDIQTFDEASRGPWGAMTLLWSINFRAGLAVYGSLITIIALAFDPFTQQILAFSLRNITDLGKAEFGAAQQYVTDHKFNVTGLEGKRMSPKIMQAAILSGLHSIERPVQFTCPSANCSWPEFTTLALSSSCINATLDTRVQCGINKYAIKYCNYTTPGGFHMEAYLNERSTFKKTNFISSAKTQEPMVPVDSTLISFATSNITERYLENPDITECNITWCARTYHGISVTAGVFDVGAVKDHALEIVKDREFVSLNYRFDIYSDDPYSGNRSFYIYGVDRSFTVNYLKNVFSTDSEQDLGQALMRSASIADTVHNITTSMSYAIGRSQSSYKVLGSAIFTQTYIKVRWAWCSLPLAVVLMGVAFLVCTMVYTKRAGVGTWKSSSLAPLYARLEGWDAKDVKSSSLKELQLDSKNKRARMDRDGSGNVLFSRC
ncbi:uncharacterized protein K452DRAFT_263274 [Aplosporella prunicola CBS 121167]|uniref:Uncharacterized protein n=1 Tax=Aplosporella prunicola CBS 121167 TaxID=1176127 RepID=A0A6A6BNZ9_9PEZI|nr:uncharacterized protein K452DRAFT_263274 [Aplosporella prunicola CBS 121167]KAF2145869.1 hypothetical protein K452DRAFT_263274 [Aplosporella prunicola CBS 121167]